MKTPWMKLAVGGVLAGAMTWGAASALARPPYQAAFLQKYDKPDGTDAEKALHKAIEAVGTKDPEGKVKNCNICHSAEKPENKKERNAYGQALAKIIMKNEKDPKKIAEALDKVAAEKPPGGTESFGDLIKAGKLPAPAAAK